MHDNPLHIGKNVIIGDNVKFGKNVIIGDNVTILKNSIVSHNCIIGDADKGTYIDDYNSSRTILGEGSFIRPFTLISQGVIIGDNFECGDKTLIRSNTKIGNNCSIGTMCDLQGDLSIGNYCRFHSNVHVGQKTIIKDYVWIYPYVVITNDPNPPMGRLLGTKIEDYAQVCTMTTLLPGITLGKNSFVGANSLVADDVLEERFVAGTPAEDICSVRDMKDINGEQYLPWRGFLSKDRGYPWQRR